MKQKAERQTLHLHDFDPDKMKHLVTGSNIQHYLLRRTRCELKHQRWSCGGVTLDTGKYSFPVRILGGFAKQQVTIGFMKELSEPTWLNGYHADLETVEFYAPGCELNYRAEKDGHWMALTLGEEFLQKIAIRFFGHELKLPHKGMMSFRVPRDLKVGFDRAITAMMARETVNLGDIDVLIADTVEILTYLDAHKLSAIARRSSRKNRKIKLIDEYLFETLDQPFNAESLAQLANVSSRSVQRKFAEACGVPPRQWARCLALHRTRLLLREANPKVFTVEGIAREVGFRHMGRFAGYYGELFGESPSVDLAKTEAINANAIST